MDSSLTPITLAYKAFDPHELLCHFLAVRGGHYEDAGLQPRLLDASFIPDDELDAKTFLVACGSALFGRIGGGRHRIELVACCRPMFWVVGPEPGDGDLAGARVATFPAAAPPARMLRAMLRTKGLDPDVDVDLIAARDDASRLGLLRSRQVGAAVISSATLGAREQLDGMSELIDVGASVGLPSTGLAATDLQIERNPALVEAVASAHRAALAKLVTHRSEQSIEAALTGDFGLPGAQAETLASRMPERFSSDGSIEPENLQMALNQLDREVDGAGSVPLEMLIGSGLVPAGSADTGRGRLAE